MPLGPAGEGGEDGRGVGRSRASDVLHRPGRGGVWGDVGDGDGSRGGASSQRRHWGVLPVRDLPPQLLLEGVRAMRGRGELRGGRAARRVPGAVQRVLVLVPEAVEERWTLLDLPAPARAMAEELAHAVAHVGRPLALVFTDAGLVQRDGADCDRVVLLVSQHCHHLHVLEACHALTVDVGDQLVGAKACLPGTTLLVYSLNERREGIQVRGRYSWKLVTRDRVSG